MAKCASCGERKGKRRCPALGAGICAACCGQKRGVEIDCPRDCGYYTDAAERRVAVFDRVVERLVEFSDTRPSMVRRAMARFGQDVAPWESVSAIGYMLYGHRDARGRCLADLYDEEHGALLGAEQRAVLGALREARFSLYEVQRVHRDRGMDIVDLVDDTAMFIHEKEGTRGAAKHDLMLTWIVCVRGQHVTSGAAVRVPREHRKPVLRAIRDAIEGHREAHPEDAEHVARSAAVAPAHRLLRGAIEDAPAPELRNMDDERLAWCISRWTLHDPAAATAALAGHPEIDVDDRGRMRWIDERPRKGVLDGGVTLGTVAIEDGELVLETNSVERARKGARLLERLLGTAIGDRLDEQLDEIESREMLASRAEADLDELDDDQIARMEREIGQQFVRRWLDEKIPALGGLTPRQAARKPRLREELVDLVDGYENIMTHNTGGPVDLGWVYEELGIARKRAPTPGPEPEPAPAAPDGLEDAREAIERLMHEPIGEIEELIAALTRIGKRQARSVLVELVEHGSYLQEDFAAGALPLIGPGHARDRLLALVRDRSTPVHRRISAIMGLGPRDPDVDTYVDDEDLDLVHARILDPLFQAMLADPHGREAVPGFLLEQGARERPETFERIERARQLFGLPASLVHGPCLDEAALAELHGPILEILSNEGGEAARRVLAVVAERSSGDAAREALERCAPAARRDDATILVSPCDGTGAYHLFMHLERRDGRYSLATVCLRAGDEVRDGFCLTGTPRWTVDELLEQTMEGTGTRLVPVEPEVASALVHDAVDVTRSMPPECLAAAQFFGMFDAGTLPDVAPATAVGVEEVSALIERDAYMDAWFFDEGDLAGHEPPALPPPRDWVERTARALASTPARESVAAMARHMALYHHLAGEPAEASTMAAAALATRDDFASSPLVHAMLLSHDGPAQDPDLRWLFGHPAERRSIRTRFLSSVKRPRGRNMATLDLSVACFVLLVQHFATVPSYARPPERDIEELAHTVGRRLATHLTKTRGDGLDRVVDIVERALGPHPDALGYVVGGLMAYVHTFCDRCPVHCLETPKLGTADHFFGDVHPLERDPIPF